MASFGPEERERLLALLLRDGILYASDTQPVRSRDGKTARWMLDSLGFSLRAEGADLAGRALLSLLGGFEGRQIATYGTTAIPLLSSCVALAGGRLNGLLVRKERKPYGSSKKIEGKIDPAEPTVLLDDSIASGTNVFEGIAALEEAGIWVEGAICLVRFGYYGGVARLQERGYQVASVFDIYSDVMDRMADEERSLRNPTLRLPEIRWADEPLPDGLPPHEAARRAIAAVLREGRLPRPPLFLDRAYDAAGGLWVSLRERREIYSRPARDGFWFFPDDGELPAPFAAAPPGAPRDLALGAVPCCLVLASAKVAAELPAGQEGLALLERCAIAVTFFSALEEVRPGAVDNDVHGVVVRSRERPGRMGGALPRMPGIGSAWREFEHARRKNAGLLSFEPYDLFRHRVEKVVEPGIEWQKSGVPLPAEPPPIEDPDRVAPICRQALAVALARCGFGPEPAPAELELEGLDTLFVSVYLGGRLRGCMGSKIDDLGAELANLVGLAACDDRFPGYRAEKAEEVAVTLAFLHQPLSLGEFSPREVMERIRLGEQALMVYQGDRLGLLLPSAAASLALDAEGFALEVIDKAGITRPPYSWRRFECSAWAATAGEPPRRLVGALPRAAAPIAPTELAELQLRFLLRLLREDGDAYFFYRPHRDRLATGLDITRRAHLGWTLSRAARLFPAPDVAAGAAKVRQGLLARVSDPSGHFDPGEGRGEAPPLMGSPPSPSAERGAGGRGPGGEAWLCVPGERPTIAEVAFLLLAIAELEQPSAAEREIAERLASTLAAQVGRHGRIATHRDPPADGTSEEAYQDFYPGQALLALARAAERGFYAAPREQVELALRYYRHRFRNRRHYGQLSWLMQAGAAWARVLDWPAAADFTFEVAALALEHQHADGSFGSPLQPDGPGYTSALFLEGLAAAAALARRRGDARAATFEAAVSLGVSYLARLTLREEHRALLPNPEWAVGGVRYNEVRDEVRIDFVQHALCVLLEALEGARALAAPAPEEASA